MPRRRFTVRIFLFKNLPDIQLITEHASGRRQTKYLDEKRRGVCVGVPILARQEGLVAVVVQQKFIKLFAFILRLSRKQRARTRGYAQADRSNQRVGPAVNQSPVVGNFNRARDFARQARPLRVSRVFRRLDDPRSRRCDATRRIRPRHVSSTRSRARSTRSRSSARSHRHNLQRTSGRALCPLRRRPAPRRAPRHTLRRTLPTIAARVIHQARVVQNTQRRNPTAVASRRALSRAPARARVRVRVRVLVKHHLR